MPAQRRSRLGDERRGYRFRPELVVAGRAWLRGRLQPVEVGIGSDGRIEQLARNVAGGHRRDYGDAILIPSATDVHVHIRDPGPDTRLEGFQSLTEQAALGGVALVGIMPNTEPPADRLERIEAQEGRARGQLAVDAFLYALASDRRHVIEVGPRAAGFKLYETPTTGVEATPDGGTCEALMESVASMDMVLSVHAEDPKEFTSDRVPQTLLDWNAVRPPESEENAVVTTLRAPGSLRLHIAHATTASTVEHVQTEGFSCEATPHHLLLAANESRDARLKVNPPLRLDSERAKLWEMFTRGAVPLLASDHAPHSLEAKSVEFDRAPSGTPGTETMLPVLLAEVQSGNLSLPVLQAAACDRPARWMGQPQGRIALNHRANLVVVDFRRRVEVRGRELRSPCGWSAFEGRRAIFPLDHIIDGQDVVRDGSFVGAYRGRIRRPEFGHAPGSGAELKGENLPDGGVLKGEQ